LYLAGTELAGVRTGGLREVERKDPRRDGGAPAGRFVDTGTGPLYHYGGAHGGAALPVLEAWCGLLPPASSAREVCDSARLVTCVEPRGRLLHYFTFRVWNWRQRVVPIRFAPGVRDLTARVDGHWVGRLSRADTPDAVQVGVPVPAGEGPHRLEVVYASDLDWPAWALAGTLEVPAPQLPVPPVSFRRIWRLAPGVAPLSEGELRRLPDGPDGMDARPWWEVPRFAWQAGNSLMAEFTESAPNPQDESHQRQVLIAAENKVRRAHRVQKDWSLGPALEQLAVAAMREKLPLVVDAAALQAAGLSYTTSFAVKPRPRPETRWDPFWESVGLVYVAGQRAALLTTSRQWEAWREVAPQSGGIPASLLRAVDSAVTNGYDESGRFCLVMAWTGDPEVEQPETPDARTAPLAGSDADCLGPRWTGWEPIAGSARLDQLRVVRRDAVAVLGWVVAAFLALLAWRGRHFLSAPWRFRLLVLWFAAAGLAVLWLPAGVRSVAWPPALIGLTVALVWYCRRGMGTEAVHRRANAEATDKRPKAAVAATALVTLLVSGLLPEDLSRASSETPDPNTVLLLPGSEKGTGEQAALVTPDLLTRVEELGRRGLASLSGAVPVSVVYQGQLKAGLSEFTAEFQVFSFTDRATFTIPLSGVELREGTFVDGALAYPTAAPGGQGGYTLPITGRGPHTVTLPFTLRVGQAGEHTDLTFAVPKLPQSRLLLTLPSTIKLPTVVSAQGAQRTSPAGLGQVRLEADLGRGGVVHVRWLASSRSPRDPKVQVREAYLWDLGQPVPGLMAVLHYLVQGGAAERFSVKLPEGMSVRTVEVKQGATATEGSPEPRLRTWQVTGAGDNRQLQMALHSPVPGPVQVTLGLVPRLPPGPGTMLLVLPTPLSAQPTEGFLAYRLEHWNFVDKPSYLGVTNIPGKTFAQVWRAAGLSDTGPPTRAYSFNRRPGGAAALALTLRTPRPEVTQQITWRAQPGYADVLAKAELTSSSTDLMCIEWAVPGELTVADVQGTDVQYWARSDGSLQIWLRGARKTTAVAVSGWMVYPPAPASSAARLLTLPALRVRSASLKDTTVRLEAGPGVALEPQRLQNLVPVSAGGEAGTHTYQARQPGYGGVFRVGAAPVPPTARILTTAQVSDGELTFAAHLDYQAPSGKAATLRLRLRHWEGEAHLEAAGLVVQDQHRNADGERTWDVAWPPGAGQRYALKLVGRLALGGARERLMPEVSVEGDVPTERWVAVTGPGLGTAEARGLVSVTDVVGALHRWPAEAERIGREGKVWKVEALAWRLRLLPPAALAAPVQVLAAEQEAALADDRRWVHQAAYQLFVKGPFELRIRLPEGARLLGLTVDGKAPLLRPAAAGSLWLSQAGPPGPRVLRMRWRFEPHAEPFNEPNLEGAHFEGVAVPAAVWTVHVPAGFAAKAMGQAGTVAVDRVELELHRAEALQKLSALLGSELDGSPESSGKTRLAELQSSFFAHLRRAEYQAALADAGGTDKGSPPRASQVRLQRLLKANEQEAAAHHFEPIRADAEKHQDGAADWDVSLFALPKRGTPTYWVSGPSGGPPHVRLAAAAARRVRERLSLSALLLIFLCGLLVLAHLPRVTAWVRSFWPEQLLVLAWLGFTAFGVSPLGVLLVVVGVGARLVLLLAWLHTRRQRPDAAVAPSGSGALPVT
jgi:hypothetical protein